VSARNHVLGGGPDPPGEGTILLGSPAMLPLSESFDNLSCVHYDCSEDLRDDYFLRERLIRRGRRANGSTAVGCSCRFHSTEVLQCHDAVYIVHMSCI